MGRWRSRQVGEDISTQAPRYGQIGRSVGGALRGFRSLTDHSVCGGST